MRQTQKLQDIHQTALAQFDAIQSAVYDTRMECLSDRRFYSITGAAWEGPLGEQFENKPKFEINKIMIAVMRIFSEYRNNRITVDFVSKEGKEYDSLAETCDSLYRATEQDSVATEAYDNAFEEAVGGGMGAWRLRADYEDDESEDDDRQKILIEPIFDADSSVYFDLDAKRQDKADAKFCFVITSMSRQAYEDKYDDNPTDWPETVKQLDFDWQTPDVVYVAEYYKVSDESVKVYTYEMIDGTEEKHTEPDDETIARLEAIGAVMTKVKKVKRQRVRKYILSGGKVLDDCGYIAGQNIPIVPVYGKRWFVDNVERCMGHVRLAKDATRLGNMQRSKLAEISALSSVEKPILTPEQVAGHTMMWADDNIKNYPYLLINPITGPDGNQIPGGPVAYTRVANIPPAMAALLQVTEQDIKDVLGNQQAGEQIASNISGKAVELIQSRLDMQTYIYMSNMAKAVKRSGEIWLSMAKDVYVEDGRLVKGINDQGKAEQIEMMKPEIDPESGEMRYSNDLSEARFDLNVEVGPTSSSKRQATVRSITGMMQITQDPTTLDVLGSFAMMNIEGEGVSDVQEFFRNKLVKMGVVKPSKEEIEKMQQEAANAQPDANTTYLEAAAEEAKAKATKARADTILTIANAEKTKAQTMETYSQISATEQKQAIDAATALGNLSQNLSANRPGAQMGEIER